MRPHYLFLLSLLLPFSGFSQNYRLVSGQGERLYSYWSNSELYSVLVDSTESIDTDAGTVQLQHLSRSIQYAGGECLTPYGGSWMGHSFTTDIDGNTFIHNNFNEQILIKTLAVIGETWVSYQRPGEFLVMAEVTSVDELNFLGITDYVKTISFHAVNENSDNISHEINGRKILISEEHGLVKTLNFSLFPDYMDYFRDQYIVEFNLVGLSEPQLGIQNLMWKKSMILSMGMCCISEAGALIWVSAPKLARF